MSSHRSTVPPTVALLGAALIGLLMYGCVSVAPLSGPTPSADPLASGLASFTPASIGPALLPTPAVGETPGPTRRPCQPGDTRPRCQTPAPATPTLTDAPTDAPTAPPTDTPTAPPPMPTGSTGGVDTDLSASTLQIDFGIVSVGATAGPISVTLTNTGGDAFGPMDIFGGAPFTTEYGASQTCQGNTLAVGASCAINYTFTPASAGTFIDFSHFVISETGSQADGEDFNIALYGCGNAC